MKRTQTLSALVLALVLAAGCGSTTPTRPDKPDRPERELPEGMADAREEMGAHREVTRDRMDEMMSGGEEVPDPNSPWYGPVLDVVGLASNLWTWF